MVEILDHYVVLSVRWGGDKEMTAVRKRFVVGPKGKKTGVVLSLRRYQRLLEDLRDLAIVAERREEEPVSLDEVKRRLKRDGLL
jgi:hypothetical protein